MAVRYGGVERDQWRHICGWNRDPSNRCEREVIAWSRSNADAELVIGLCTVHAKRAQEQVDDGTRPHAVIYKTGALNEAGVIRYLVEVARG